MSTPAWVVVICALIAALGSLGVALVGRGTSKETNAISLNKNLVTELDALKKEIEAKKTKDDQRDRRLSRLERVLDAAIDHIQDWEEYHSHGDVGEPPDQPWIVRDFRERTKNETEEHIT